MKIKRIEVGKNRAFATVFDTAQGVGGGAGVVRASGGGGNSGQSGVAGGGAAPISGRISNMRVDASAVAWGGNGGSGGNGAILERHTFEDGTVVEYNSATREVTVHGKKADTNVTVHLPTD